MFRPRQKSGAGTQSSTHVAVRPGYQLLAGTVASAERHGGGLSAKDSCSECAWAYGDYGQPGGLVVGLTSGYGTWASRAATHACLALQLALPKGKQWIKLSKGKQLRALKQAFASVRTPSAIGAERGRSGALAVALFLCPQSGALFLASTGGRLAAACSLPPACVAAWYWAAGKRCRKAFGVISRVRPPSLLPPRQGTHCAGSCQPPEGAGHRAATRPGRYAH
jgi:hypothetical protein